MHNKAPHSRAGPLYLSVALMASLTLIDTPPDLFCLLQSWISLEGAFSKLITCIPHLWGAYQGRSASEAISLAVLGPVHPSVGAHCGGTILTKGIVPYGSAYTHCSFKCSSLKYTWYCKMAGRTLDHFVFSN